MITRVADARAQWAGLDHGSPPLTPSSFAGRKRMRTLVDWRPSRASARQIASALIAAIGKGETFEHGRDWRRGWVWSHLRSPPTADRSFSASASEATDIFASC